MSVGRTYEFGKFRLDVPGRLLFRGNQIVPLTPKVFDTLSFLVERQGQTVEKEELMRIVWPDTFVEESGLTRNISVLRKALGDSPEGREFILTIPKRGYRFVAAVQVNDQNSEAEAGAASIATVPVSPGRAAWMRGSAVGLALAALLMASAFYVLRSRQGRPRPQPGRIMLAVLPVQNLSGDPELDYISDGLTEEMIAQLGGINADQLGVIARTSAMTYKHSNKRVDQIGQELGVDYALESSLRGKGDGLRVTTQLIRVRDQTHLWAESYDRALTDAVALQADVARAIAAQIQVKLSTPTEARLANSRRLNPDAYLAYLHGRYQWNKRSRETLLKSIEDFQRAIQIDPGYAQAHAGLADAYASLALIGDIRPKGVFPKAKAAALQALQIDDSLAEAHTSLAYMMSSYDWDWAGAEREFRYAIDLNPGYATAHQWFAEYLRLMGREDEALQEGKRALDLDPLSPIVNTELGLTFYFRGQNDEAIACFRKALDLDPNFALAHIHLGWAFEEKREYEKAISELQIAARLDSTIPCLGSLGHAYAVAGKKREAENVLLQLEQRNNPGSVAPHYIAQVYAGLGQDEKSMDWLEKSYAERYWGILWLNAGPRWNRMRSNPRFIELLKRMNFP